MMNIKNFYFLLLILLSGTTGFSSVTMMCDNQRHQQSPPPAVYRKAPYLIFANDATKMTVLWQLFTNDISRIKWGLDTTCSLDSTTTMEYGDDHQHKITIAGLTPQTKYYYQVTTQEITKKGHFTTGNFDDNPELYFYIYGDTRTHPSDHNSVARQIVTDYTDHPEHRTFIINTGDLVENGNKESDWDEQFFDATFTGIQQMLATLPYMVSLGNHEGNGTLFKKYFPFEMYDPANSRYYYSFDYGPAHFTVIDQFTDYKYGRNWKSEQYQWIENDLASTAKKWKFILLHMPGWSAGSHRNDYHVKHYIQPLAEKYNVQFIFSGHNHYYARAEVNGVHHITSGGGGAPLYSPIKADSPGYDYFNDSENPFLVKTDDSFHFCSLHVTGDSTQMTVTKNNGTIIETISFPVKSHGAPIDMTDFDVLKENCTNVLKWVTVPSSLIIGFEIQYSTDGQNWSSAGWIKNREDSTWNPGYAFEHTGKKGWNYYRLKQINTNGEYHFSAIKKIQNDCDFLHLWIFPNPVTRNLHVKNAEAPALYEIFNLFGQKLTSAIYTGEAIDISALNNGSYIIRIGDKIGRFAVLK